MKRKYQEDYASNRPQMYDDHSRVQKAKRIPLLVKHHLKIRSLKKIKALDVGASTGIIDNELAKYFGQVVGTDIDNEAIKFAKKKFKRKNLKFKVEDAMGLSFKDETFDLVVCTHVYEHVPNVEKLFKEIHRVLKKNGICYLAAQNKIFPWEPHHNLIFLSWLPKKLADKYVSVIRDKDEYYEHPMTYWSLRSLLNNNFDINDYTSKILVNPSQYGYDDALNNTPKKLIAKCISPLATYLFPTFFWVLEKK